MSRPPIGVVDYGIGNLRSVLNALDAVGSEAELVHEPGRIRSLDKLLLPGVGAFEPAIRTLRDSGMVSALDEHVAAGKALLGICLGMQLMCASSTENGEHKGLGWIPARVLGFPDGSGIKVPHMGWNELSFAKQSPLIKGVESGADVYFVHSYYVACDDQRDVLAITRHGLDFASMFARENLFGMQFHPEKSQEVGLALLTNFAAL